MKNLVVMGAVGVGLFGATVVGLLAAQGRLNYEGTVNIPVVNSFFAKPPENPEGGEAGAEGHGADGAGDGHAADGGPGKADGHAEKDAHGKDDGHEEDGPGTSDDGPTIEYVEGKSIKTPAAPAGGGHGGGHGEAAGDGHGDEEKKKLEKTPTRPDEVDPETRIQEERQRRFERQKDWLHSIDNGYRGPGDLFQMPRIKAGMSVSEINSVVARAQAMMKDIERKQAVLEEKSRNLSIRERDIADRQSRVSKLINEVEAERTKVEKAIEEFNRKVFYLKPQEEAGLREIARTVGSLSPEAAKELIMSYWRTPEGQEKAIKIMAVMDREQVDAIIGQMETQTMREILEKRMALIRLSKNQQ